MSLLFKTLYASVLFSNSHDKNARIATIIAKIKTELNVGGVAIERIISPATKNSRPKSIVLPKLNRKKL